MSDFYVQSRDGTRFPVATNEAKVDANCPIDGTQLVAVTEHDDWFYSCNKCGASYRYGDKDPDSLITQARVYVGGLFRDVDALKNRLSKLEITLKEARESKVFE